MVGRQVSISVHPCVTRECALNFEYTRFLGGDPMRNVPKTRPRWRELVDIEKPLILPAVYDALSARIVEAAGFKAMPAGGFAMDAAQLGFPDIDLTHFGEKSIVVCDVLSRSTIPVLVDGDDGYGDVKNV